MNETLDLTIRYPTGISLTIPYECSYEKTCCLTSYICFGCETMFVHFLQSVCSQPPHVAHDHKKWLHMDLIHLFKMLVDFFLAAFDNFLRKFLQTCQMSNWWLILGHSSFINFFICTCLSVVICFILISLASMPCKTFWKPYFSILFEFPHSVNYITDIATILLILCSKNVYAKYFALCLGLSHLLSPLNQGLI